MIEPKFQTVDIDLLKPNPWNTNVVTPENEEKIRASITRNGLFKPVICREIENSGITELQILGGEHRWDAARELGHAQIMIVNLGPIDDKRAKEIGVIDNARYGADDTLAFSDLLKELGASDELQTFLPYGDSDLQSLFSASDIALDDLGIDERFEKDAPEEPEPPAAKAPKTHTIQRFKLSLLDAERMTALIAKTMKTQGFTTADDLTNAGDALVHLLMDQFAPIAPRPPNTEFRLEELEGLINEEAAE